MLAFQESFMTLDYEQPTASSMKGTVSSTSYFHF